MYVSVFTLRMPGLQKLFDTLKLESEMVVNWNPNPGPLLES